jgi:hypothetical protein
MFYNLATTTIRCFGQATTIRCSDQEVIKHLSSIDLLPLPSREETEEADRCSCVRTIRHLQFLT